MDGQRVNVNRRDFLRGVSLTAVAALGARSATAAPAVSGGGRRTWGERLAVKGMLPHNALGAKAFTRLKVYAGAEHKHEAQKPVEL